jgi:hypothetical protein
MAGPVDTGDMTVPPDLLLPRRDPTDHAPSVVLTKEGSSIIANPEVWTIVWSVDKDLGQQVQTFTDWMLNSNDFWVATLSEYGIGKGKAMGVLVINDAPPATLDDSAVAPLIKAHVADGSFPQPNANTIFSFLLPMATKSTMHSFGGVSSGCTEYGGYHSYSRPLTGVKLNVPYAINLNCGAGFGGNTAFDSITEVVSHELSEASTDPVPGGGYYVDPNLALPLGNEIADLCTDLSATFTVAHDAPDDGGVVEQTYFVNRNWSNKASLAGNQDPCQPVPADKPYFNVATSPTTFDIVHSTTDTVTAQGEFQPFAFGDVGEIKWQVYPLGTGVTVSPSKGTAMAGDTIGFTISVTPKAQTGGYMFLIYAQSAKGGVQQWSSTSLIVE